MLLDSGRISLKMLRYFDGVARHLHFGRAAEELCISKSALSTQVRELEQLLDTPLLSREQKRVALTPAGERLKLESGQLLAAMDRSLNAVRQVERSRNQSLTIGLISSALWDGLFDAIALLRQSFPALSVQFLELAPSEQRQALLDRKIDLGLCRIGDRPGMAPLAVNPVVRESLCVALWDEHPLADRPSLSLAELAEQPLVSFDPDRSGTAARVLEQFERLGLVPQVRYTVVEPQTMMAFVGAGQAVALVPQGFCHQPWQRVRSVPLSDNLAADLCVAFDPKSNHPLLPSFIEALMALQSGGGC